MPVALAQAPFHLSQSFIGVAYLVSCTQSIALNACKGATGNCQRVCVHRAACLLKGTFPL